MTFADLPHDQRMAYRRALEAAGANIMGYEGRGITVAIKRGCYCAVQDAARDCGLVAVPNALHHFPLGSDNPPEEWRHDGSYPASRGFWLFDRFHVA